MKSYTDLEQSKRLTDILPLESADMRIGNYVGKYEKVDGTNVHYYTKGESFGAPEIIYAWSLAALLNILPSSTLDSSDGHHYRAHCKEMFTDWYDNPIDCCIAMIERLHELKML